MRVLLVNDLRPGPSGGAEVHVGRLADALDRAGCEVRLVVAEAPHVGWRRVLDLWDPWARRRVVEEVRRFRPDVVHLHNVLNELSASVAGCGAPTVLTVHDSRIVGIRSGPDRDRPAWAPGVALRRTKDRLAGAVLRRGVDATVAPSRSLADALVSAGFPGVHHVENFAAGITAGPLGPDVAYVGLLQPHKGPQVLLEAWARVASRHPTVALRFVGDGPLRSTLERRAVAAGIGDRVRFTGELQPEDVAGALGAACLVVVPSLGFEGGGPTLAVIDAMAAGRGVVVSDRPGVVEGVDDEVGAIVPAGDAAALATVLDALLADRPRLERLGRAAAARAAQRWTPEGAVARLVEVYAAVAR